MGEDVLGSLLDSSPGAFAAAADPVAALDDVSSDPLAGLANLTPDYASTLLPSPTSDMSEDDFYNWLSGSDTTDVGSSPSIFTGVPSQIVGQIGTLGNNLLSAFVTNPQNAATAEAQSQVNTANAIATSSNLFGYLIIGLVIFLIFGLLERK